MNKKWLPVIMLVLSVMLALAGFSGCGGAPATPTTTSPTIQTSTPGTVQTATPITSDQTSASVTAANGLSLALSIDSPTYQPGAQVSVTIDEKNTLAKDNNVAVADLWPVKGLLDGPAGTINYPFGMAILRGNYDAVDVASATPLILYDPNTVYFGPMVLAGITSYDFQPLSDVAGIYTQYDSVPFSITMTAGVTATGSWSSGSSATLSNFAPGTYTVVGGDEWGALVVLHFVVA